mmetsp:Transcript_8271/g.18483  ORF Transcript_8271/g.18483 Transcript_8271/m.18483 type:complete len:285 (-) Transcript_8271:101-955(-)
MAKPDSGLSLPLTGAPPLLPGTAARKRPPAPPRLELKKHEEEDDVQVQSFSMATPKGSNSTSRHFIGTPTAGSILNAFLDLGDADADDDGDGAECPPLDFEEAMRRLESQQGFAMQDDAKADEGDSSGRSTQCTSDCDGREPSLDQSESDCSSDDSDMDDDDREECYESDFETDSETDSEEEDDDDTEAAAAAATAGSAPARPASNRLGLSDRAANFQFGRSYSQERRGAESGRRERSKARASSAAGTRNKERGSSRAASRGAAASASRRQASRTRLGSREAWS